MAGLDRRGTRFHPASGAIKARLYAETIAELTAV
jgi:hypothetical protein